MPPLFTPSLPLPPGHPVLAKSLLGRETPPSSTPDAWPHSDSWRGLGDARRGSWHGCLSTLSTWATSPEQVPGPPTHLAECGPTLPHVPSPHQCGALRLWFRQLTNPAMQSGSLIANSFYGSWAHLCHHMQNEKKKKIPLKKSASRHPIPQTDSKRNKLPGFFWLESHAGSWDPSWGLPSGRARQSQGAGWGGMSGPQGPDC